MMRYEKPEMELVIFEQTNVITNSNLYTNDTSTGGNEGSAGWGGF